MKLNEVFDSYGDFIMPTYAKIPLVFVKGKGSCLCDINGRPYLDFFPGWGVCNVGHCHPKVMRAIREQAGKLIFIPNNYYHIAQAKLASELARLSFPSKVFFCNSGAEANEAAIKFSRKFGKGQRHEIITFQNSFHGRTLAALSATGQKKYQNGFEPLVEGFKTVRFNDLEAVKKAAGDKTVAVMLELVQGEGGVNIAEKDFVQGLRKLCDEKNMLLIIDEVQTGIGRTGKYFCYQNYNVTPDVVTLAKALGGGLPIGTMLVKKDVADILQPGTHASTFGGGPVVCRAALAVLAAIEKEKMLDNAGAMGEFLAARLNALKEKYPVIKEVRGLGLMWGAELEIEGKKIAERCLEKGLLINCTHERVLRFMPALTVTRKEIERATEILEETLKGVPK
ncbi:MAG: aspartate aminotransferase family protein [Candidatus Omnitrophota bacterium]